MVSETRRLFHQFRWFQRFGPFGTDSTECQCNYNVIVIDLLGPSLEDLLEDLYHLFNFCNWKFSLKTVLLQLQVLADNLIHRDITVSPTTGQLLQVKGYWQARQPSQCH